MKRTLLKCTVAVLAVIVIGCAPKIVSTEGGVYQDCKLYAVSERNMDAVYNAALQAMNILELKVSG